MDSGFQMLTVAYRTCAVVVVNDLLFTRCLVISYADDILFIVQGIFLGRLKGFLQGIPQCEVSWFRGQDCKLFLLVRSDQAIKKNQFHFEKSWDLTYEVSRLMWRSFRYFQNQQKLWISFHQCVIKKWLISSTSNLNWSAFTIRLNRARTTWIKSLLITLQIHYQDDGQDIFYNMVVLNLVNSRFFDTILARYQWWKVSTSYTLMQISS